MNRVFYLIQKEFRQIVREKAFIGIIFVMPFIQIVVLGFAITTDVRNLPIAVVDEDHSRFSRRLTDAVAVTESFDYQGLAENAAHVKKLMDEGRIKAALMIPRGFERDIKRGEKPQLQAMIDGVDGNSAGVALAYLNRIALNLQQEWIDQTPGAAATLKDLSIVQMEPRMLYNASLESKNNIVPGIIAVLITMITSFLTGMSIVREKEIGTLEQLMVTPIRSAELMLGKIIPFLIVGLMLMAVGILAAGIIFGIWMKGSLFLLVVLSLVFSLSTLGLGILASTVANTQQQSMFITWFFAVFALLLSGFFIPIENMPDWVQIITYANPLRYYMVIIREIYLKGTGFVFLWKEAVAMGVFGIVMFTAASLRFRKRLS